MSDLSDIRREYTQGGLRRADLPTNPMDLFEKWNSIARQIRNGEYVRPSASITAQFSGSELRKIVSLCHPDKHRNSKAANDITAKALAISGK